MHTPDGESSHRPPNQGPPDLDVLSQLVANSESPFPHDLPPDKLLEVCQKVRNIRRLRLHRVLAAVIASSLERAAEIGAIEVFKNRKNTERAHAYLVPGSDSWSLAREMCIELTANAFVSIQLH